MKFTADKVKVSGPRVDGAFTVTFEVGEYEADKVADLIKIPQQTMLKIDVTTGK